jgi:glycine cleavage system H protein
MTALLVVMTIVILVAADATLILLKRHKAAMNMTAAPVIPFASANPPKGLFLDGSHTWVRMTDSGELRVGVDELLAQALGGADRVELPKLGSQISRGQTLVRIWRKGRRLSVPSPVDGTVVTSNSCLEQSPSEVAEDPYGSGWLSSIWPIDHREALKPMNVGESGKRWMEGEVLRFSEFLAGSSSREPGLAMAADGAHPAVGAALALGDEAWADFQKNFAGTSAC